MVLSLEHLTKSYGANLVLSDITAKIEDSDRIGFVGPNGAGKSTLLNIIYGELDYDGGSLSRGGKTMGFLRQSSGLDNANTIQQEMRSVFAGLYAAQEEMLHLGKQIAATSADDPAYAGLAAQYDQLQTLFEAKEGYLIDVKISTVLNGMGFLGVDLETPVDVLSGGERTRLALCKLLLEGPELLILDEPTNHLDFRTLLWLEDYLRTYKGALLIVSHDRYFLDQLCTTIWSLEHHRLDVYNGNYSQYVSQKDERLTRQWKEYEAQQQEIAEMKDFIARNIVRASTTARAQSRQKALDRMDVVEKPRPPAKPPKIRFQYSREPVKDVLEVEGLTIAVGDGQERKQLCTGIDFAMLKGEKIALIGHNGVGKTSFLKALLGMLPVEKGHIYWGKNTELSYFEQGDVGFHANNTAINELWDRFPRESEHTIRTVLGNVGLTGENVFKRVGDLSGGERAKLKFAVLVLKCGNVLLMDEPTNHLDASTKESLDTALCAYTGTLLVVSHDRYLLNKFPDKIAEMHGDHIRIYKGNYESYRRQKANEAPSAPAKEIQQAPQEKPVSGRYHRTKKQRSEDAARKRRITQLEEEIEALELLIFQLENETADPEIARDYLLLQEKCDLLAEKRLELTDRMNEWTILSEEALLS